VQDVTLSSWLALGYLIVFGSILAFSAYMFLLRRAPASRVSTHAYVNPLIAVALGAVAVNEPINASIVIASFVIASGVALVLGARQAGHDGEHKDRRDSEAPRAKNWRRAQVLSASGVSCD
jgi:drug/metabolite transporter (DMT)-like permease